MSVKKLAVPIKPAANARATIPRWPCPKGLVAARMAVVDSPYIIRAAKNTVENLMLLPPH